jgi:NAD(P)H-dependent FMN reductase
MNTMKTILGIVASPRKLGNCELVVKEIARNIPEEHRLELIRLQDLSILPCKACYRCLFDPMRCIQKDDFQLFLDRVLRADGIIVAAPTYLLGANALLKLVQDRGLACYGHIEALWRKPAIGVGVAGIPGREGRTHLDIYSFLKFLMTDIKSVQILYGTLPGEVFLDGQNLQTAAELGRALFAPAKPAAGQTCPICGGNTFQFLDRETVRCMVCSNAGTMRMTETGLAFDIVSGEHEMLRSLDDLLAHRLWLQSMKQRFMAEKDRLKTITQRYREGFEWVRPQPAPEDRPQGIDVPETPQPADGRRIS